MEEEAQEKLEETKHDIDVAIENPVHLLLPVHQKKAYVKMSEVSTCALPGEA
jgi:hypothetical protein